MPTHNQRSASVTRRKFLKIAAGAGVAAGTACAKQWHTAAAEPADGRKLIIVVFGGGTRTSETIGDPEHRHIPRLWKEMVPRGTLLSNMRVEGRVVHPNSVGSIVTGHWEWDDLDWERPVQHPTVFEIYRRAHGLPDTAAWAFVYASILAQTGQSGAAGYGEPFAANVVQPPTIPRTAAEEMGRRMQAAAATGSPEAELAAAAECARLARFASRADASGLRSEPAHKWFEARYQAWRAASEATTSHDAFLAGCAVECMREFSPGVLCVALGEIDCAHYGSWSRYVEAIRRTDELAWRLWRAAEELPGYRGRTLMLILPDHGRELERPGGPGFLHHSDFYANTGADEGCRRVWMLGIGPGVAAGRTIERPVPITAAAATGLASLGLRASEGAEAAVLGAMRA
jgi:hypothetical protein